MAKKWLKTTVRSEVDACNASPYGYPSKGTQLEGGVASDDIGGPGWTVQQFPVEESATKNSFVVEVDDNVVPAGLKAKLASTKPPVA